MGEDASVIRLANASGYSTNGRVRVSGAADTSGWLAAAWEVPEVAEWGTEYHTIVGEDLDLAPGCGTRITILPGLEVMAWQDGTVLTYNGGDPIVLNAGETILSPA